MDDRELDDKLTELQQGANYNSKVLDEIILVLEVICEKLEINLEEEMNKKLEEDETGGHSESGVEFDDEYHAKPK